jgi:hypothetical protein
MFHEVINSPLRGKMEKKLAKKNKNPRNNH